MALFNLQFMVMVTNNTSVKSLSPLNWFITQTFTTKERTSTKTLEIGYKCKLQWLTFYVLMNFLQNVLYSNATNAL
jgi:hypothetical protein